MAIWGDEVKTEYIEGCVEDEKLSFKLWDGNTEFDVNPKWIKGSDTFVNNSISVLSIDEKAIVPLTFELSPPFPNPFNSTVRINYSLDKTAHIKLIIYDIMGRRVDVMQNAELKPGRYSAIWNASMYPSGMYLVKMDEIGGRTKFTKMMLMK